MMFALARPSAQARRGGRGFALPMVLLLAVASSILLVVMLERQGSQSLTVQRDFDLYVSHHTGKGMAEAISAWIMSNSRGPLAEALGDGGHAFDIEADGGQRVRVTMEEAQGTLLAEFAGLAEAQGSMARAAVRALADEAGADAPRLVRREGPMAVSALSAPRQVLVAAASAVVGPSEAAAIADEILRARAAGPLDAPALVAALRAADPSPSDRAKLQMMLTTQPTLWRVAAESEPAATARSREPLRYEGLAVVSASGGGARGSGALQRNSSIIAWERVREWERGRDRDAGRYDGDRP